MWLKWLNFKFYEIFSHFHSIQMHNEDKRNFANRMNWVESRFIVVDFVEKGKTHSLEYNLYFQEFYYFLLKIITINCSTSSSLSLPQHNRVRQRQRQGQRGENMLWALSSVIKPSSNLNNLSMCVIITVHMMNGMWWEQMRLNVYFFLFKQFFFLSWFLFSSIFFVAILVLFLFFWLRERRLMCCCWLKNTQLPNDTKWNEMKKKII